MAYTPSTTSPPTRGPSLQGRLVVVEGTCKVWQRVKDRFSDKLVRGNQIDAVRVRVIGVKEEYCAAAVGVGVSDVLGGSSGNSSSGDSSSGDSSSSGSSGSSGTVHMLHRLLAWCMSFLLLLGGTVAFLHGISRFVPQVQEQKVKLGDYLGYIGIGLAVLGVFWFEVAAVLPLVWARSASARFPRRRSCSPAPRWGSTWLAPTGRSTRRPPSPRARCRVDAGPVQ